ncbi:phage head closure protein (plasmid) [Sarcina sp. JB2]|uniref:Phage head closure protein n=1 Tax=Candidatus Sarcina troglodytae TaxID=2726954 RepID=A0ACD1BGL8_9CLOT|nr:phage head closure protein [Sarcina sp. JB2]QPJ86724.1 phage head closure protein [Sarcina sp. JB2]
MIVNPSELNERIVIGTAGDSYIDDNGFTIEEFDEVYSLRCKVKTVSTKEYINADREISAVTLKFLCRFRKGIKSDMLIKYDEQDFNIKHIHLYGKEYMEITAVLSE